MPRDATKRPLPFRPPCGGWRAGGPLWYAGGFFQHWKPSEDGIAKYTNTTKVADWHCSWDAEYLPGGVPPYPRLRHDGAPSGGDCTDAGTNPNCVVESDFVTWCADHSAFTRQIFCGPWPLSERPVGAYNHNSYGLDGKVSLATCRKGFFKNVQSRKAWHGIFGFLSHDPNGCSKYLDLGTYPACNACSYEAEQTDPDETKYLTATVEYTLKLYDQDGTRFDNGDHADIQYGRAINYEEWTGSQTVTVNRYSGVNTIASCTMSHHAVIKNPDGSLASDTVLTPQWRSEVTGMYGSCSPTPPAWVPAPSGTGDSFTQTTSNTVNDIVYEQSYTTINGGIYNMIEFHGTITLSNPYTGNAAYNDVVSLLGYWSLANDAQYPWRRDSFTTVAPLVTYNEVAGPVAPLLFNLCGWTDPNGDTYDGSIRGAPLPAGYQGAFDWDHVTWKLCNSVWYDFKYGAVSGPTPAGWINSNDMTDQYMPSNATQWTNNFEATLLPHGNWVMMAGTQGDFSGPGHFSPGVLMAQKYVEAKVVRPSVNFFRPCGGDRDEIDQTTINCVSLPAGSLRFPTAWPICGRVRIASWTTSGGLVHVTLAEQASWLRTGDAIDGTDASGSVTDSNKIVTVIDTLHFDFPGATITGSYIKSHGAPAWYWHDDNPKGDYVVASWLHNFRDYQERARFIAQYSTCSSCSDAGPAPGAAIRATQASHGMDQSVKVFTVMPDCLLIHPCCQGAIACTPNGETFENGRVYAFPSYGTGAGQFHCDERYGAKWQMVVIQHMVDPLWQAPHVDCVTCDGTPQDSVIPMIPDDGSCRTDVVSDPCSGGDQAKYYPLPPYVECRVSLPSNGGLGANETAPSLPSGIFINVLSLTDLASGSPPDGLVWPPPAPVGFTYAGPGIQPPNQPVTPWSILLAEQVCTCGLGASLRFKQDYEEDMAECDDA